MDPLLEQFLQEARENLAFIDQNIEEIGGDDPELLNSVFRAAHTLKGGSGIVGFDSIRDITHHAEDLLDMLRSKKIEFKESMTEALFNAFDEVMNLVEAAEESGGIVEADSSVVDEIIEVLNEQMNKTAATPAAWNVPFLAVDDAQKIINLPLPALAYVNSQKVAFKNSEINQDFCFSENLYAILFDVDEACMVYGNDPIYALSLLGDKVISVYSCISDESTKSILSGTEDENGLLLKSYILAYVYATYEEIENSLFNFIDELQFLPLDIATLLSLDVRENGHKLDSLKELSKITKEEDMDFITQEVEKSMELIGTNTLQYAQLQRFLEIAPLIKESDIRKLEGFFSNLYRGEVYKFDEVFDTLEIVQKFQETESEALQEESVEVSESIKETLTVMMKQQHKALECVQNDSDLQRVLFIMQKIKKFMPHMPENLTTKGEIASFLDSNLHITSQVIKEIKPSISEKIVSQKETSQVEKILPKQEIILDEVQEEAQEETRALRTKTQDENKKSIVGKTVKIDQESIDSLMNVVGELLVAKNSLPYLADNVVGMTHDVIKREIMEKYIFINRLSEQLQDLIMGMRMLPISYVFDRYPKLVRDIAKKLGKKVNLEMEGGETKLDKNMIEMLADPMIHIMRNSLDHGLEAPEIREQKGKDSNGLVTLKAYAESDRIIIEIVDDGAGINIDKVANKVLEKGLMTYEQIDALTAEEKAELVLLPGLSTAETITEFSGRGVGMDVVKKSIEAFGGTIKIKTKANHGTTITLAIPVSLAVTSLLHIQMNDIHYGIPMDSVSETVKLEKEEIEYLHNEPFVYIRGEVIPLLFIKSMLNEKDMEKEPLSIVVLNIKENLLAVVVNRFLGQLDVVQKPLVGIMESHPLFSGTALLGNGQIIMAIDPIGLLGISQKLKADIKAA
ncbi:MAG: chemotaxis protein CheA [Campylobacterales bacterium]|nr:chemotaxis protein CheA [Campylobacterales bacterium]